MKFEREYYVGIKDIGLDGKMSNYGILSILEEIASTHSDTVGYGVNDIEKKKKVWLLMDWKLQVLERPKYGNAIKVKTWARPIAKRPFSTYRDFEIYDGEKRIAIATSKWILFDLETNRIAKIYIRRLSFFSFAFPVNRFRTTYVMIPIEIPSEIL